jgi:protein TonB
MTNKEILQADLLDILFEHRNKLYGAYALRKTYDRRLGIALGAALLTVLISLAISFLKNGDNNNDHPTNDRTMILKPIEIPKDEPKPEPIKAKPPVATRDYQTIVVVADKDADSAIVTISELDSAAIGNKNIAGEVSKDPAKAVGISEGEGEKPKEPETQQQADLPSYPPKFPGDWPGFLQRYLQSPEELEPGQRVEVLVRFWVDVDGSVSRPEVIKSGGASFDKEVLRVLKKMPKWEPAMQAGHRVAVAYTQPVIFMGVEE